MNADPQPCIFVKIQKSKIKKIQTLDVDLHFECWIGGFRRQSNLQCQWSMSIRIHIRVLANLAKKAKQLQDITENWWGTKLLFRDRQLQLPVASWCFHFVRNHRIWEGVGAGRCPRIIRRRIGIEIQLLQLILLVGKLWQSDSSAAQAEACDTSGLSFYQAGSANVTRWNETIRQ